MEENALPPGFRFHPTDEELITCYLSRKVSDVGFVAKAVSEVDLNKCEPWDLPAKASMGEKEWYFFSLRDRKYPTGLRTNRATEAGYWKTTGKDKDILRSGLLVGMKKTLVFYRGRAPRGEKTNWVMHEYRLENKYCFKPTKEEWVLCRVFQKTNIVKKQLSAPSDEQSPDSPDDTNSALHDHLGEIERMPSLIEENPNLTTVGLTNNISTQIPTGEANDPQGLFNFNNLNWPSLIRDQAPALLPFSPLSPSNLAVNTLLLKALQLRSFHQQLSSGNDQYPVIPNTAVLPNQQLGSEHLGFSSFPASSSGSSSRVLLDQHQQEQPFNWTPFSEDI
ncbi:hypothetical protein MLD38_030117 [Melastoma candidum]|uniref:Uncharacterized protein n=1 Tax=Melastoma candidum TaxID=119954 RepID=A0ACB9MLX9_9MYRT|nr:hypothetical protein MLD38_030117 [Melastoma candidum]